LFYIYIRTIKNKLKMAYPEKRYHVQRTSEDLPQYTVETTDQILARQEDGMVGYISVDDLKTTLDGAGLATDTDISASNAARVSLSGSVSSSITSLSGSIATKMANTSFGYITGSFANDGAAASAGVAIGGLYHTTGTVKVRLT
jgi:hypothetical protein